MSHLTESLGSLEMAAMTAVLSTFFADSIVFSFKFISLAGPVLGLL